MPDGGRHAAVRLGRDISGLTQERVGRAAHTAD